MIKLPTPNRHLFDVATSPLHMRVATTLKDIWAHTYRGQRARMREHFVITEMSHGGLYFAKTDSDKSENQYGNLLNRTLPNQESAKPESAKTHSGIC